jgi:hypothetical protein
MRGLRVRTFRFRKRGSEIGWATCQIRVVLLHETSTITSHPPTSYVKVLKFLNGTANPLSVDIVRVGDWFSSVHLLP